MGELFQSMFNLSCGMSLLGVQGAQKMLTPDGQKDVLKEAEDFFSAASKLAADTLSPEMKKTYDMFDEMGKNMVAQGTGSFDPSTMMDPSQFMNSDFFKNFNDGNFDPNQLMNADLFKNFSGGTFDPNQFVNGEAFQAFMQQLTEIFNSMGMGQQFTDLVQKMNFPMNQTS